MDFSDLISKNLLFDSHCHLNEKAFNADRDEVVERAQEAGVKVIIDMPTDLNSTKQAIADAEKYEIVYASVGIDAENLIPESDLFDEKIFELSDVEFKEWLEKMYLELKGLSKSQRVIMIGETGMDSYWLEKNEKFTHEIKKKSLIRQELLFRMHCRLANELNKPLSIHSRNCINTCLQILQEEKVLAKMAVFHSLTLDIGDDENSFKDKVLAILQKHYYIGVNGIITFKNATMLRNVYQSVLLQSNDNLTSTKSQMYFTLEDLYKSGFLLETDAPFLAPEPHRGQRNEPGFITNIRIS